MRDLHRMWWAGAALAAAGFLAWCWRAGSLLGELARARRAEGGAS